MGVKGLQLSAAIRVSPNCALTLGHVFSPVVMDSLILSGYSRYLSDILISTGIVRQLDMNMSLRDFFETIYATIARSHRAEYVYKNAIANKILLGRHSLNTASMLTELRVGDCRADVVILNHTSSAYEIKSELDSFDRLSNQLNAYTKVFDLVSVITSHQQLATLHDLVPQEIGLVELTEGYTIKTAREPISMKSHVRPEVIFDSLRKPEYVSIIRKQFGQIPNVSNTRIYTECKFIFSQLSPELAHDEMVRVLTRRTEGKGLANLIEVIPPSLKAYAIGARLSSERATKLEQLMHNSLGATLVPNMT